MSIVGYRIHLMRKPLKGLEGAKAFIKARFPRVDFGKLGPIGFNTKGTQTGIVSFGPRRGESKIFRSDGQGLNSFIDKFSGSLGPIALRQL